MVSGRGAGRRDDESTGVGEVRGRTDGPRGGTSTSRRADGAVGAGPNASGGRLRRWRGLLDDAGMATAEYAIVLLAAVGFAGLLVTILKSSEVRSMLTRIVRDALTL